MAKYLMNVVFEVDEEFVDPREVFNGIKNDIFEDEWLYGADEITVSSISKIED